MGMGFPGGSVVNNLLAMQEIWVQPLGQEDPLEEEMATHSTILAWRISWTEETGRLQSMGSQKSQIGLSDLAHKCPQSNFFISLTLSFPSINWG